MQGERDLNDGALDFLTYWITDSNYPMLEGAADSRILHITLSDVDASEIIWRLRQVNLAKNYILIVKNNFQKFFTQTQAVNFFVRMKIFHRTLGPLPEFSMKREDPDEVYNLEKLCNDNFLLARYPLNADENWLAERKEYVLCWNADLDVQQRRIIIKI